MDIPMDTDPIENIDIKSVFAEIAAKFADQNNTLSLMQTQLEFQNEKILKQDEMIENLLSRIDQLTLKVTEKEKDANDVWKNNSIVDAVKETAQSTLLSSAGYVFDPQSKLYCNYTTGYYYDPAHGLYYNGHTGVYYTFDADKNEYIYHSRVELSETSKKPKKSNKKVSTRLVSLVPPDPNELGNNCCPNKQEIERTQKRVNAKSKANRDDDMEDGEITSSSVESCSDTDDEEDLSDPMENFLPPCLRIIVKDSPIDDIKPGSLLIVPYQGGTIGREGKSHVLLLPDSSVEMEHAEITFKEIADCCSQEEKFKFYLRCLTETSHVTLNGQTITKYTSVSEENEIVHGSTITIGKFTMLTHIHAGSNSCGHCEPGLLASSNSSMSVACSTMINPKSRNAILKQVKKKYGISAMNVTSPKLPDCYVDRARERRLEEGSDNPYEKTQVASVNEAIPASNKGFQMLSKMGWSKGTGLNSTTGKGIAEPVSLEMRIEKQGLGACSYETSGLATNETAISSKKSKNEQLAVTMKRFREAEKTE